MTTKEADRAASVLNGLRPIGRFLRDASFTDLCVNRPRELWAYNGRWQRFDVPEFTYGNLYSLMVSCSAYGKRPLGPGCPIVSCALPGGSRAQFLRPPAVAEGTISITVRHPSSSIRPLEDYVQDGFFSAVRRGAPDPAETELRSLYADAFPGGSPSGAGVAAFLRRAVRLGKNIVIAGETGSGKTTLMKSLLQEIPPDERVITIEDVPEIAYGMPAHANQVNLFYPSESVPGNNLTASALLRSTMRMKPDRIIVTEIRGAEAFDFLSAALSGHNGTMTTCHAGSCAAARDYLALRVLQSEPGSKLPWEAIQRLIDQTVDIFVHICARGGERRVTEIRYRGAP